MNQIAQARSRLDDIETTMMHEPWSIEALRPIHAAAREAVLEVERAEAERRARLRRLGPSPGRLEALWREFKELLPHVRRSQLSAAQTARLVAKFGRENYLRLRW